MTRLGYNDVESFNNLSYDAAQRNFETATTEIEAAQVVLNTDLQNAGILNQNGEVSANAGFMQDQITDYLEQANANTIASTQI
jgi:hypothetical protein